MFKKGDILEVKRGVKYSNGLYLDQAKKLVVDSLKIVGKYYLLVILEGFAYRSDPNDKLSEGSRIYLDQHILVPYNSQQHNYFMF